MSETDLLADAGKEQGEIIARYLIRRMQDGEVTPTEAVNLVAAHFHRRVC